MKRLAMMLVAGLWLAAAGRGLALELGDIEVGSLRGEPLMARIALIDLAGARAGELKVGLGGPEAFARAGIERLDHLLSLEFEVVAEGAEPPHIMIRGRDPVDSPSATFLVEAVGPSGRTLREYTVLLDAAPRRRVSFYGPVRSTDTLWSLAGTYRSEDVSVQRMMLAMLALNPHAFSIANVNALRKGAILEIPAPERIGPDDKASAIREVHRQNEAWKAYFGSAGGQAAAADIEAPGSGGAEVAAPTPSESAPDAAAQSREGDGEARDAELRVVVPASAESTDSDRQQALRAELDLALEEADSKGQELVELNARLDEAEQLIVDLQRLVHLKDDDIAALAGRLAAEAEAAEQARAEAAAQARTAALARAEAVAQAEAAARAREEAAMHAEAAAALRREVAEPATLASALDPPLAERPQDEREAGPAGLAALPDLLRSLEDELGFSPVVGGVGLVGVILILGGLISLMRRRGSAAEDPDEEESSARGDTVSNLQAMDRVLEKEGVGLGDGDASSSPAKRTSRDRRGPLGEATEVEDFDIGIDTDAPEGLAAVETEEDLTGDVDEFQTKLDLAQTYIDMEDFDNARVLLREVQAEGDLEQRAIARYLAGKIP